MAHRSGKAVHSRFPWGLRTRRVWATQICLTVVWETRCRLVSIFIHCDLRHESAFLSAPLKRQMLPFSQSPAWDWAIPSNLLIQGRIAGWWSADSFLKPSGLPLRFPQVPPQQNSRQSHYPISEVLTNSRVHNQYLFHDYVQIEIKKPPVEAVLPSTWINTYEKLRLSHDTWHFSCLRPEMILFLLLPVVWNYRSL